MNEKTIYVIPDANDYEIQQFVNFLQHPEQDTAVLNKELVVFKVQNDKIFRVVTDLVSVEELAGE
jgi:hypothetical protein